LFFSTAGETFAQRTAGTKAGALVDDEANQGLLRASCVLMLRGSLRVPGAGFTGSGTSSTADLTALTTAMTTTGLIDPAAKAALDLDPREWSKVVRVEITQAGAQAVKLTVTVDPGPNNLKQTDPAGALLRELINRAKAVVTQSVEPRRQEVKSRLDELEKRRTEMRSSLETIRKRLREAESANVRSPVIDPFTNLRRQFESELATKRFRLQAIKDVVPRFADQADNLSSALKSLVEAREALVAGLEKAAEQGKADPLDVLRARAELAEARVRAAEPVRVPGFSPTRNPRDERLGLEVDIAALEAQLKAMPEKVLEPARPIVEDVQSVRSELFRLEAENNNLEQQFQQARREFEQLGSPPSLITLDGHPSES
jgi:hypothetical protein